MVDEVMLKPLFLPLNTQPYEAFERGDKHIEYRLYGKRWNEKTCIPGRDIILSKGYGKKNRMGGVITNFYVTRVKNLNVEIAASLTQYFGTLDADIACIVIKLSNNNKTGSEV